MVTETSVEIPQQALSLLANSRSEREITSI